MPNRPSTFFPLLLRNIHQHVRDRQITSEINHKIAFTKLPRCLNTINLSAITCLNDLHWCGVQASDL